MGVLPEGIDMSGTLPIALLVYSMHHMTQSDDQTVIIAPLLAAAVAKAPGHL